MLARATAVASIATVAALSSTLAVAFDLQRFTALRTATAAARAADPVGLAALTAFDGPDLVGGDGPMARAGLDLALLYSEHADYVARGRPGAFVTTVQGVRLDAERVLVDAVADGNGATLLDALENLGLANGAAQDQTVSGWLPIAALDAASRAPGLRFVRPAFAITNVGSVTSQGDLALAAAAARQTFGVDGTGVTVGVISNSFNCLNGYSTDVATGDLPSGVDVLEEIGACSSLSPPSKDEGRAMLQIVHDVAPGAALAFHSGFNGTASFAAGIVDLVSQAGADIVVDDVGIITQPMFQDGPIAQAVDSAVALGAAYFSAAGNQARQSYEADFVASTIMGAVGRRHAFSGSGGGPDTLQQIDISAGAYAYLVLQWDQPFFSVTGNSNFAATSDLDLVLYGGPTTQVSGWRNVGNDAVDVLVIDNTGGGASTRQLAIERFNNISPPTRIKCVAYVLAGTLTASSPEMTSGTVVGHANAAGARAVGAARYSQTPAYGVQPTALEAFSSRGGTTVRLSPTGAPITSVRRKPELVAVDGVDTRFFPGSGDTDGTGYPNFFGTSAAAPHAAGLAALARDLDSAAPPGAVYAALLESALDMGSAGYDDDSGAGLVQADRTLASIAANAGEGVGIGFGATAAGAALASPFPADQFASVGVRITDSDTATGTSQTALPSAGPTGPLSGSFLYAPAVGTGTWIDLELTPAARDVQFDFATPSGQIALTGYDATGNVVLSGTATATAPFAGPGGGSWLAGSAALPATLYVARLRIAPVPGTAALAVDNLRFTTASVPAADVPIPLPAVLAAVLMVVGGGYRRLRRRSS